MNIPKRLTKIETSLTPKQAVLAWLKAEQQIGIETLKEKTLNTAIDELPEVRIPLMVARTVLDSAKKEGWPEDMEKEAGLSAVKQAVFLVVLVLICGATVCDELNNLDTLRGLYDWTERMAFQYLFGALDQADCDEWKRLLVALLRRTWRVALVVDNISKAHYDGHTLLHPVVEDALNDCSLYAQWLVGSYNRQRYFPGWREIDVDAIHSSAEAEVPAIVQELVARAEAKALLALGQPRAAWELLHPYNVAAVRRISDRAAAGRTS